MTVKDRVCMLVSRDPLEALHATFGFSAFRGKQADVVERVLAGRSTLAVMPTGAGKSLTYQLPSSRR
jgi:ATP-dependent DNA helicase RecQ